MGMKFSDPTPSILDSSDITLKKLLALQVGLAPAILAWSATQFVVPNVNPVSLISPNAGPIYAREAIIFSVSTNNAAGAKIGIVGAIVIPLIAGTFYEIKIPSGNYVYDLAKWFVIGNANDQFYVTWI